MKKCLKNVLCSALAFCSLASACAFAATDVSNETLPLSTKTEQNNTSISPMSSVLALDMSITKSSAAWAQLKEYVAYRIWVDNTTGALMTVTITSPSGKTKNLYITSGSNKTYTDNNAESGIYKLAFHTYADTLSGTVRVRVSTRSLL